MSKSPHVVRHRAAVSRPRRETLNGHLSVNLWFTGLSGSGKSTLAHAVEERLHLMGCRTYVFDGDNVRHGICGDLGFSLEDRSENMRRIAEMVNLFLDSGVISLTAFISPLQADRERVKKLSDRKTLLKSTATAPLKFARKGMSKDYTKRPGPVK